MLQLKPHEVNAWWTALMRMDPMTAEYAPAFADRCVEELRLRCADIDKKRETEAAELEVIRQRNLAHMMEQTAGSTRS